MGALDPGFNNLEPKLETDYKWSLFNLVTSVIPPLGGSSDR